MKLLLLLCLFLFFLFLAQCIFMPSKIASGLTMWLNSWPKVETVLCQVLVLLRILCFCFFFVFVFHGVSMLHLRNHQLLYAWNKFIYYWPFGLMKLVRLSVKRLNIFIGKHLGVKKPKQISNLLKQITTKWFLMFILCWCICVGDLSIL